VVGALDGDDADVYHKRKVQHRPVDLGPIAADPPSRSSPVTWSVIAGGDIPSSRAMRRNDMRASLARSPRMAGSVASSGARRPRPCGFARSTVGSLISQDFGPARLSNRGRILIRPHRRWAVPKDVDPAIRSRRA
jgi:hypothetical protein